MVMKKSEYQKQFRSSTVRKHQDTYLENLKLRYQRRDREFLHTPICWLGSSEEDEDPSSSDSNEECAALKKKEEVEPQAQYQSLAEILSVAKDKANVHRQKKFSEPANIAEEGIPAFAKLSLKDSLNENNSALAPSEKPCDENNVTSEQEDKHIGDKSYSIGDLVDEENRKLNEKIAEKYTSWKGPLKNLDTTEDNLSEKINGKFNTGDSNLDTSSNLRKPSASWKYKSQEKKSVFHGKPSKSSKCPKIRAKAYSSEPKPSSQSVCERPSSGKLRRPDRKAAIPKPRPASSESHLQSRPPFLAYGAGDVENNLATHRTHNVLATSDVYIRALRAKTRREEEQKLQKKKRAIARNREALLNKLAQQCSSPRDGEDWRSEYQKQFPAYDTKEYERAASARAVIPHMAPIRAVHRGGCLVVNVD